MASADVDVRIRVSDAASRGLRQAGEEARRAASRASAATAQGVGQQQREYQRLSQARERLGIRPEREIQREIQRTQAAYNRLRQSGSMSWREQARAAEQVRQRVTQLTNEMGRLTRAQKAAGALKLGAAAGAGLAAAGYVVKDKVKEAIGYDYRLAGMANVAFSDRDKMGRKAGMKEIEAVINESVKSGGGTREGNAEALNTLLAANAMSFDDMKKIMPELAKAATASGASMTDLANIANTAIQNFGIDAGEISNILNMAVAAGQAGKFELEDMAQHLPIMLAAGKGSGMRGLQDFAGIVSLAQAAALTAGSNDQAGTNMTNLLNAMSSKETAGKIQKKMKVSLPEYLQKERERGVNSIDAFAALMTKSVEGRADYKALQKKIASAGTDEERQTVLAQMSDIAMGAGLGEIISEKRALMALFAMVNNQSFMKDVRGQVLANNVSGGGAVDQNFGLISDTAGFRLQQAQELTKIGEKQALDSAMPTIDAALNKYNEFAGENSGFVGAASLAIDALKGLAVAAGIAAVSLGGGRGVRSLLGKAGTGIGAALGLGGARSAATAGAGLSFGARAASIGMGALKVAGKGGIGVAASIGGEYALGKVFGEDSKITEYGSNAISGAATGALIGSVVPVIGTGVGAAVGAGVGLAATAIKDLWNWFTEDGKAKEIDIASAVAEAQGREPVEVQARIQVNLAPGLVLQGQQVQASGNVRLDTGNVNSGASG